MLYDVDNAWMRLGIQQFYFFFQFTPEPHEVVYIFNLLFHVALISLSTSHFTCVHTAHACKSVVSVQFIAYIS